MKLIKKILLFLIVLYPLVLGVFYLFQEQIIFHEKSLDQNFKYSFPGKFEEIWLKPSPNVNLNALYFHSQQDSTKGIVVYLHGNSKNLNRWGKHAPEFTRNGYDILIVDYRTFGKSTGPLSEAGLIQDGQAAYDYALKRFPKNRIILYGRSLGSGIAAQIALKNTPKMLLLETPYASLPAVAKQFLPIAPFKKLSKYQLATDQIINQIQCPIHIFHGTKDRLVFYENSLVLCQKLGKKPADLLTTIEGGGHRNLAEYKEYHSALDGLLKK